MREEPILKLSENTRLRQILEAKPPVFIHGVFYLCSALLLCTLLWSALSKIDLIVKAPGRIRTEELPLRVTHSLSSNTLAGRISKVHVRKGDSVQKGDLLLEFDQSHLEAEVRRLQLYLEDKKEESIKIRDLITNSASLYESERAKANSELERITEELRREGETLSGDMRLLETELEVAAQNEHRQRALNEKGVSSKLDYDQALVALARAIANKSKALLGVDESRLQTANLEIENVKRRHLMQAGELALRLANVSEQIRTSSSQLQIAELDLAQCRIVAEIDGVITEGEVQEGDRIPPGEMIFVISGGDDLILEVMVSTQDIGKMQTELPARVKMDAFDYQKYGTLDGRVFEISPDSTMDEKSQSLFYVVKINLQSTEILRGPKPEKIKLGMSGIAEIITDEDTILALAFRELFRKVSLH